MADGFKKKRTNLLYLGNIKQSLCDTYNIKDYDVTLDTVMYLAQFPKE